MKKILQGLEELKGKTITDVCECTSLNGVFIAIHTDESVLILESYSQFSIEYDTASTIEIVKSLPYYALKEKALEKLKIN